MKNLIKRTLEAHKRLSICLVATMFAAALSARTVNYTADNSSIFTNPERGFITMLEGHLTESKPYAVKGKEKYLDTLLIKDKGTLVLVEYYLENYKTTGTIPSTILDAFDEDMNVLRNRGMKCIIRYAYTDSDAGEIGYDASLDIVKQHIDHYKSHWEANTDVIFCFQAGFIGSWGEWYYTSNFGNKESHINASRRAFLDTLISAAPHDRYIQLRTPFFKTDYLDSLSVSKAALTEDEAYKDTPKARLAHHNDAFLNGAKNQGTYSDTATQKPWLAQETLYVPIGGENNVDSAHAEEYGAHDVVVAEMSRLHWTFIQGGFRKYVTNMWRKNGTFDELNRNLGYRFQLVSSTIPDAANAGTDINVSLQIKNVGYAPLYNERHAYLVLKNKDASYSIQLDTDPRTWKPNGVTSMINETISLPSNMPTGKYQLYLHLPDNYPSIADDPRYAVRFANSDVWNETTGMNRLQTFIEISSAEPAVPLDTVALPGTLNKANVADYYDDTWSGESKNYYDFGSSSGANTTRWVEWKVDIEQAGKYVLTEVFDVPTTSNGHEWRIDLLDASRNKVDSFNTTRVWANGAERVEPAKWVIRKPGIYTLRVTNAFPYSQPKLKSLQFEYFGPVSSDTVTLPNTLDISNVADYSDQIGWYNTEYFDYGSTDKPNLDGWVEWNVNLKYPGEYIVTEVFDVPGSGGHEWQFKLLDLNRDSISSYNTTRVWKSGRERTDEKHWDLSSIPAGKYYFRVYNAFSHAQPKLKSLTLTYDGELPTDVEQTEADNADTQAYDILGRPVDESYHGIVIMRGKKILR